MVTQFFVTVTGAKQGDFKGESTQKSHEGKIQGVAFSYGVLSPRDGTSGLPTGKRQHQPVVFSKEWGASSPQFYQAIYTNESLPTVLFEFFVANISGAQVLQPHGEADERIDLRGPGDTARQSTDRFCRSARLAGDLVHLPED